MNNIVNVSTFVTVTQNVIVTETVTDFQTVYVKGQGKYSEFKWSQIL